MRLEEKIRSFKDNNGVKVEFRQIRFGNGLKWIDMYIYVDNNCLSVKGFYENRKRAFEIIKVCENAQYGLLQAIFSKLK